MKLIDILRRMLLADSISLYTEGRNVCYHITVQDLLTDHLYRKFLDYEVTCIFGLVAGTIGVNVEKGED